MFRSSIFLLTFLLCAGLAAQTELHLPQYSDSVSVSLVNLYASVRNSKGRPVSGLKKQDFTLYEDGKRQVISNFSADVTEPVNIAFLLDVSGSMRMLDKFEISRNIVRNICSRLAPDDEVALLIFADGEVELLVDFTKDKQRLINRMAQLKPYGGTALRNAVAYCSRLLIASLGKKGIILLSDGVDNRSDLTMEQAMEMARRTESPIYAFELIRSKWADEDNDEKQIDVDEYPLKAFADSTGGLYFTMDQDFHLDIQEACLKIFEDLKYQYYIGYTPRGTRSAYGKLTLRTKDPKHRVRVRYSVIHGG
ncbi:MAG TPA: VWA domain-containing protein [Acidobacteriota bacterium]|nr:VWA domain-containing protein [Acidobacteriota bacterium]